MRVGQCTYGFPFIIQHRNWFDHLFSAAVRFAPLPPTSDYKTYACVCMRSCVCTLAHTHIRTSPPWQPQISSPACVASESFHPIGTKSGYNQLLCARVCPHQKHTLPPTDSAHLCHRSCVFSLSHTRRERHSNTHTNTHTPHRTAEHSARHDLSSICNPTHVKCSHITDTNQQNATTTAHSAVHIDSNAPDTRKPTPNDNASQNLPSPNTHRATLNNTCSV